MIKCLVKTNFIRRNIAAKYFEKKHHPWRNDAAKKELFSQPFVPHYSQKIFNNHN